MATKTQKAYVNPSHHFVYVGAEAIAPFEPDPSLRSPGYMYIVQLDDKEARQYIQQKMIMPLSEYEEKQKLANEQAALAQKIAMPTLPPPPPQPTPPPAPVIEDVADDDEDEDEDEEVEEEETEETEKPKSKPKPKAKRGGRRTTKK